MATRTSALEPIASVAKNDGVAPSSTMASLSAVWNAKRMPGAVDAEPDDLHAPLGELRLQLGHLPRLGRANRREFLGVREQDRPVGPHPIMEPDRSVGRVDIEIGRFVAGGKAARMSPIPRRAASGRLRGRAGARDRIRVPAHEARTVGYPESVDPVIMRTSWPLARARS